MKSTKLDTLRVALRGTNHIEASAGTGKTYSITNIYLRLLLELGLELKHILVVTFTEAATAELKERIRSMLQKALVCLDNKECDDEDLLKILGNCDKDQSRQKLIEAQRAFDEASIFTIHGFCNRMLHENAFESGVLFDTELLANQTEMLTQIAQDYWSRELVHAHPLFIEYLVTEKYNLDSLVELAKAVTSRPDRLIVPEKIASHGYPEDEYSKTYDELQRIWKEHKDEISKVLEDAYPGLNGRSYKIEQLPKDLEGMGTDLGSRQVLMPCQAPWIKKFATREFKVNKTGKRPEHAFFDGCQKLYDLMPQFDQKFLRFRLDFAQYAKDQLAIRKEQQNRQSYDDMLTRLHKALGDKGDTALAKAIRDKYRAALIDEFQDTDSIQIEIFTRLFSGQDEIPVFQIGDPKQSIYGFRGADVFSYIEARKLAGHHYTMSTNWRSDPGLISGINFLFSRIEDPFLSEEISYETVQARPGAKDSMRMGGQKTIPIQIRFVPQEARSTNKDWAHQNIPRLVASDIAELLRKEVTIDDQALQTGDIAVLVMKNKQARSIQEELKRLGIPSVRTGDSSVFGSQEAADLSLLMAAIAKPTNSAKIRASLATSILGLDANKIFNLNTGEAESELAWESWIETYRTWHEIWKESGFIRMFRAILNHRPDDGSESNMVRLVSLWDGERRITNLLHLSELLYKAATEEHLGPEGLVHWFDKKIATGTNEPDESQLRLETDQQAVKIVTVFKAKGLEYPVVFCPYFWDGKIKASESKQPCPYHDPQDSHRSKLDLGEDLKGHRELEKAEIRAESMRLLYVALTRAKHLCVVTWTHFNHSEESPLGRLLLDGKKLDDVQTMKHLGELEKSSVGSLEICPVDLPLSLPPPLETDSGQDRELSCRTSLRHLKLVMRTLSYSGMVGSGQNINPAQEQGLDHDEFLPQDAVSMVPDNAPSTTIIPSVDMPKGSHMGSMLHAILEELDFSDEDPSTLQALAKEKMEAFGLDPNEHLQVVCRTIRDCLETNIDSHMPGFRLQDLPVEKTFREMHFWLPANLRGRDLPKVFDPGSSPNLPTDYARSLAKLGIQDMKGFLQGYIDLIYSHQGRWYVVDYKSNFLGESFSDYGKRGLAQAMEQHHYYLQYHLYTLALHRYLRQRMPSYDYQKHMGGVFYLFLRGMSPDRGPEYGVFSDNPSVELISNLDRLISGQRDEVSS